MSLYLSKRREMLAHRHTVTWPQDHSAAEKIRSLNNLKDPIGNPTRDLPACRAVPQSLHALHTCYKMPQFILLHSVALFEEPKFTYT